MPRLASTALLQSRHLQVYQVPTGQSFVGHLAIYDPTGGDFSVAVQQAALPADWSIYQQTSSTVNPPILGAVSPRFYAYTGAGVPRVSATGASWADWLANATYLRPFNWEVAAQSDGHPWLSVSSTTLFRSDTFDSFAGVVNITSVWAPAAGFGPTANGQGLFAYGDGVWMTCPGDSTFQAGTYSSSTLANYTQRGADGSNGIYVGSGSVNRSMSRLDYAKGRFWAQTYSGGSSRYVISAPSAKTGGAPDINTAGNWVLNTSASSALSNTHDILWIRRGADDRIWFACATSGAGAGLKLFRSADTSGSPNWGTLTFAEVTVPANCRAQDSLWVMGGRTLFNSNNATLPVFVADNTTGAISALTFPGTVPAGTLSDQPVSGSNVPTLERDFYGTSGVYRSLEGGSQLANNAKVDGGYIGAKGVWERTGLMLNAGDRIYVRSDSPNAIAHVFGILEAV